MYHPTIVRGVNPDMKLPRELTFGPVAPIEVVKDREEGLVVRETSVDHGQVRLTEMTPSGRRLLIECDDVVVALEDDVLGGVSAAEFRMVRELLARLV